MAFPIPSHLPRKKDQEASTKLLSKMSETAFKSLTNEVASSWVAELNVSIQQTKDRIRDRIQADLPALERQVASSQSVQERLQSLSANVDRLSTTLTDPETGLVPHLITSLTRHAVLAQETADTNVKESAVSHLARCRTEMQRFTELVKDGQLPEATVVCEELEKLLVHPPRPLEDAALLGDLKRAFRALKDRTDEQLNDAYSRSIVVNGSEIIVRPFVQVRASNTVLPLTEVVSSLSPTSLNAVVGTLRRDLTTFYISGLMKQPASITVNSLVTLTGDAEHTLTVHLDPPHSDVLTSRIDNLSTVLTFLNEHVFPQLSPLAGFPVSLSKPLTSALLNELLIPSLPSDAEGLHAFLQLMDRAVLFEQEYIEKMLGDTTGAKGIKSWSDAVAGHYERKKRVETLEHARAIILRPDNEGLSFRVSVTIPLSPEPKALEPMETLERAASPEEAAWGFEENGKDVVDDWSFGDEEPKLPTAPLAQTTEEEESAEDAWGLGDDEDQSIVVEDGFTDSSAWDDPWGESDASIASPKPKAATRLEKLSSKGKRWKDEQPVQSPTPVPPPPPTPAISSSVTKVSFPKQPRAERESYLVSGRVRELISLIEHVLAEAADLSSSGVFTSYAATSSSPVGHILRQTAMLVLELYRALYPVTTTALAQSTKWSLYLSNDCLYLSDQVSQIAARESLPTTTCDQLGESAEIFKLLSDSWYDDTLHVQGQKINIILDQAGGFVGTTDQYRFDECEAAVNRVLQDIRQVAQQCKPILTTSRYYQAVGIVVDSALSRVLTDILALPDITEVESHNLSELCRILNALEGLFVGDPSQPSFVVAYVPSWLKFSYLSELLEASIADISYLFEEGALVDFEIQELINLVRALFADTPLRANTINKLMQGHPPMIL